MFNKKKRKQKISIATFFIVLLNIIFTSVTQMGVAYAAGTPFKLNSDVVMKVNGNPVNLGSVVELAPGNKVDFEVTYSADNEAPVPQEGDEFKFVLPSVFKDIKPVYPENHFKDMTIEEQNGETVVTLICGPDIDTAIGGFLKISATVSQVEVEVPGKIIIEINGKEIVIDTETNPPGSNDKLIDKKVNGQDNDYTINPGSNGDVVGQEVPYSVMVNGKYTHMENAVFTDDIPEGMELVEGSVKVEKIVNGASQVIKDYEIKSTNPLVINLNTINHKHKISYKLKVTEFKNEYLNKATITSSTTGSESDSVKAIPKEDAKGDSHINKTIRYPGSYISPNSDGTIIGQKVGYRVEVNSVKESKENVVFKDNIPDGMNLVKNSVKIFKEVRGQNIDVTSEFSSKITQQDNLLKIAFGDISNKYIVEYETIIVKYKEEYKNDATITYNGSESSGSSTVTKPRPPGEGSLNKTVNGKDNISLKPNSNNEQGFIGQKLKYSILVNNELKQKNNLVLRDVIPEGMKILENTIKVYIDNGYNSFSEVNASKVPRHVKVIDGKEVLVVDFGDTNRRYRVDYQTEITELKDSYKNTAEITWDGGEKDDSSTVTPIKPTPGKTDLNKKVNGNSSVTVSYDKNFIGRTFDYEIIVNDKIQQKDNVVLKDSIPKGMELVDKNIKVLKDYGSGVYKDVTSDLKVESDKNSFTINLGNITDRYKITYKTKITELVETGYKNTAVLTHSKDQKEESSAVVNIKAGSIDPGENEKVVIKGSDKNTISKVGDKVKYHVDINPNNKRIFELVFEDTIPTGMKLIKDGFKVTETDNSGKVMDRTQEFLDNWDKICGKDESGKNDKLTINFGDTYSKYRIEYMCEITALKKSYENTAKVTGRDIDKVSKDEVNYAVSAGGINATKYANKTELKDGDSQIVDYTIKVWSNAVFPAEYLNIVDKLDSRVEYKGCEAPDFMKVDYDKNSHTISIVNTDDIPTSSKDKPVEVKLKVDFTKVPNGETVKNVAKINDKETPPAVVTKGYKFEAVKVDGDNNNAPLKGVEFDLYKVEQSKLFNLIPYGSKNLVHIKTLVSDDKGLIYSDLKATGNYVLREVKAPEGYSKLEKDIEFEVKDDSIGSVVKLPYIVNNRYYEFGAQKIDGETGKGLQGAEFRLEDAKGNVIIEKLTSNDEGKVYGRLNQAGKYYLVETKAPEGYMLSPKKVELNIEKGKFEIVDLGNIENKVDPQGYKFEGKKVDSENGNALQGAEFRLEDAKGKVVIEKLVSDKDGKIYGAVEREGKYYLVETKAPEGYMLSPKKVEINIEKGKFEIADLGNIENKVDPQGYKFEGKKVDSENGNALQGAEFRLEDAKGKVVIEKLVSDKDGKIYGAVEREGKYYLLETKAPEGYMLSPKKVELNIEKGKFEIVDLGNIENKVDPEAYKFEGKKVDSENGNALQGAEFRLEDAKGKVVIEKLVSDKDGKIYGAVEREGKYYLLETKAPEGYMLSPKKTEVNIEKGKFEIVDLGNIENKVDPQGYKFEGKKVDSENGNALQGAEFRLEDAKGKVVIEKLVSDKDGKIYGAVEREGKYYLVETKAPEGYMLSPKKVELNIEKGKFEIVDLGNIENKVDPQGYKFEGKKVDSENGNALQGAEFRLEDAKGKVVIEKLVSDKDGKIYGAVEREGKYYLVETKAPEGYILSPKKTEVNIEKGKFEIVNLGNIENKVDPQGYNFEGKKVDSENGNALQGAEFRLEDAKGKVVIEKLVSDKDGKIYGAVEREGKYYLVETKAPEGYMLSPKKVELNIEKGKFEIVDLGKIENKVDPQGYKFEGKKVDSENGNALQGAEFRLEDAKGKVVIEKLVSDKDGKIYGAVEREGKYYLVETKAPEGYMLSPKKVELNIEKGKFEIVDLGNIENEKVKPTPKPDPEKPKPVDPDKPSIDKPSTGKPNKPSINPGVTSPATGDASILTYSLLGVGATGLMIGINRKKKK